MQFVRNFSALFLQNPLHFPETSCIITNVVTLIAVKREVAAQKWQVFRGANVKLGNWRQVTDVKKHGRKVETTCDFPFLNRIHTGECTVTACRTGLKSTKRRRLFLWQVR